MRIVALGLLALLLTSCAIPPIIEPLPAARAGCTICKHMDPQGFISLFTCNLAIGPAPAQSCGRCCFQSPALAPVGREPFPAGPQPMPTKTL
jgi:hypothetical protein